MSIQPPPPEREGVEKYHLRERVKVVKFCNTKYLKLSCFIVSLGVFFLFISCLFSVCVCVFQSIAHRYAMHPSMSRSASARDFFNKLSFF